MTLRVLIVGGGRVGGALARLLVDGGHAVTVLEPSRARGQELGAVVPGADVVTADGTDPTVLEGAGIRTMDVLAAVTGDDARNLVVTALGRFEFDVPRTIARIVDPTHAWLFDAATGVDVAVDQADLLTRLIVEEMSMGEVATLVKLRRGDLSLVEERVPPGAPAEGRAIGALGLPAACVVIAVLRGEEVLPSRGDLVLEAGDELLAVVHSEAASILARAVASPGGHG
jgi:trk system potassium uptake protein